jgi:hypothetical protein
MKLAIAAAAACLAAVGCSAASGAAHSAPPASARDGHSLVIGAIPTPQAGGRVHLSDETDSDSPTSGVILSGAIGDFGTGTLDQSTGRFVVRLSRGSFTLQFAELDAKFLANLRRLLVNQSSCSAFAQVSATASIVSGAGTGSYAHLTGGFALTATLDEVFHPGACAEQSPYASQETITSGWGTVHDR